jgi:hypothetical protein
MIEDAILDVTRQEPLQDIELAEISQRVPDIPPNRSAGLLLVGSLLRVNRVTDDRMWVRSASKQT